jgi:hypothetical protein
MGPGHAEQDESRLQDDPATVPNIAMMDTIDDLLQLSPISEKAIDEVLQETRIPTREGFDRAEFRRGVETIRQWAKIISNLPSGSKEKTYAKEAESIRFPNSRMK